MAIKKTVQITADSEAAIKAFEDMQKKIEELDQQVRNLNTTTESVDKSAKSVAKGFKGVGLALKAAGVGLFLKAFGMLQEIFMTNSKIVDGFTTVFNFLALSFNDFFKWVEGSVGPIRDYFKSIFNDPKQAVMDLGQAIIDNLVERFESLIEAAGFLGDAIGHLFKGEWSEAADAAKEAGKEMVDVFTGVDGSVEKISETVTEGVRALGEYTKSTWNQAEAMTNLNNQALVAEARNERLLKGYMLQAEQLRQLRDDERKTIDERIQANKDLGAVLDEQERVMRENAQLAIDNARAKLALDENNTEAQIELENALYRMLDVEETVAGFRSEYLINQMGLEREALELQDMRTEGENKVLEILKRGDAERTTNQRQRMDMERALTIETFNNEKARLQAKIEALTEGTLAHQQAMNEMEMLEAQHTNYLKSENQKRAQNDMANFQQGVQMAGAALDALLQLDTKKFGESEAEQRKAFEHQKKGQLAATAINTATAVISALATPGLTPWPVRIANALTAGIMGVAQSRKIKATQFQGGGSSGQDAGGMVARAAVTPDVNIVQAANTNKSLGRMIEQNDRPMRAYVTSQDVVSAASLERNVISNATIGK